MTFTNRGVFDSKCCQALRALVDLRTRAENQHWVGAQDSDYTGGISAALDAAVGLNSVCNALVRNAGKYSNIVFFGDSVTQGRVPADSGLPGYVEMMRLASQRSRGATRGEGVVAAYKPSRFAYAGTWTNHATYGPFAGVVGTDATGGARKSVVAASTATIQLVGDSFDIYYVTDATTAAFTVTIDSDAPISIGGASGSTVFAKSTVAPVNGLAGRHNIVVTSPASGGVIFWGVTARSFGTTGAQVHNISLSGTTASNGGQGSVASWLPTLAPDLTVFAFEINDYAAQVSVATFTAQVQTLLDAAKITGAVAIIATNSLSTSLAIPQSSYVAALASLAASNGAAFYCDIFNRWGGTSAAGVSLGFISGDLIHPTSAGHADMALAIDNAIGIPAVQARSTYGIATVPSAEHDMSTLGDYGYGQGGSIASVPDANTGLNKVTAAAGVATADSTVFGPGAAKFVAAGQLNNNVWNFLQNVTKYTQIAVFQATTPWANGGIAYEQNNQTGIIHQIDGIRACVAGLTVNYAVGAHTADANKHVVAVQYDGSQAGNATRLRIWLDGVLLSLTFTGTIPASLPNLAGSLAVGQAGSYVFVGEAAHSLFYVGAAALTDVDMLTVGTALKAKWGTV